MASRRLVKTVSFPARSKPHMLRVSPDGKEVWVQTAEANTNVVLDASDLAVLSTEPTGKQPVTNAWTRDRRARLTSRQKLLERSPFMREPLFADEPTVRPSHRRQGVMLVGSERDIFHVLGLLSRLTPSSGVQRLR